MNTCRHLENNSLKTQRSFHAHGNHIHRRVNVEDSTGMHASSTGVAGHVPLDLVLEGLGELGGRGLVGLSLAQLDRHLLQRLLRTAGAHSKQMMI